MQTEGTSQIQSPPDIGWTRGNVDPVPVAYTARYGPYDPSEWGTVIHHYSSPFPYTELIGEATGEGLAVVAVCDRCAGRWEAGIDLREDDLDGDYETGLLEAGQSWLRQHEPCLSRPRSHEIPDLARALVETLGRSTPEISVPTVDLWLLLSSGDIGWLRYPDRRNDTIRRLQVCARDWLRKTSGDLLAAVAAYPVGHVDWMDPDALDISDIYSKWRRERLPAPTHAFVLQTSNAVHCGVQRRAGVHWHPRLLLQNAFVEQAFAF